MHAVNRLQSFVRARARVLTAMCLGAIAALSSPAQAASQAELEAKVQALADQLQTVQRELAELRHARSTAAVAVPAAAPAPMSAPAEEAPRLSWFGYGEMNYSRPSGAASETSADVARFVLGAGYRFDDQTRFVSELELEHAVSSADDPGEVEVEQAYIERELSDGIYAKAGLFLIPSGLLNESHEPTFYYGVFRNFVETAIIPTTWREGGVAVQGKTSAGLRWDLGLTTSINLANWDFSGESEGQESPLGSVHQELAEAHAKDLSAFAAVNYSGVPGLTFGASIFTGDTGQGQAGFEDTSMLLWEGHARWSPGNLQLSALYAQGHLSGTRPINRVNVGNPVLIPEEFFGWYVEGAYRVASGDSWSLSPFLRYETFNTGSSYANIGVGLTPDALADQKVWTGGLNFTLTQGVVLKADYVKFQDDTQPKRFDLGLGYQF
jgi:hypothetical protein